MKNLVYLRRFSVLQNTGVYLTPQSIFSAPSPMGLWIVSCTYEPAIHYVVIMKSGFLSLSGFWGSDCRRLWDYLDTLLYHLKFWNFGVLKSWPILSSRTLCTLHKHNGTDKNYKKKSRGHTLKESESRRLCEAVNIDGITLNIIRVTVKVSTLNIKYSGLYLPIFFDRLS